MAAISSFFSSPRRQRQLFWIGGTVLVVGVVAFIVTDVWTSPKQQAIPAIHHKVVIPTTPKSVPLDPQAKVVGERFIETAVERKNLAASWRITAPVLRQDFTLKRWLTGNIPVVPYPADTSRGAPVKIEYSYRNEVLLLILLEPKKGDPTKPQLFHLGLHAFGKGAARHWMVDYWGPFGAPHIPNG